MAIKGKIQQIFLNSFTDEYLALDPFSNPAAAIYVRSFTIGNPQIRMFTHHKKQNNENIKESMIGLYEVLPERVKAQITARKVCTLIPLPSSWFTYRTIDLPFTKSKDVLRAAPFELEPRLLFSLEEMSISFIIATKQDSSYVFSSITKRDTLTDFNDLLSETPFSNSILECEAISRLRFILFEKFNKKIPSNDLIFIDQGPRGIHIGYTRGIKEVSCQFIDLEAGPPTKDVLSLIYYTLRCMHGKINSPLLVLLEENNRSSELKQALTELFPHIQENKFEAEPLEKSVPLPVNEGSLRHLTGILLAFLSHETLQLTPIHSKEKKFLVLPQLRSLLKKFLYMSSGIMLFLFLFMGASYYMAKQTYNTLVNEEKALFMEAFPSIRPVISPINQARSLAKKLEQDEYGYASLIGPIPLSVFFSDIARVFSESGSIHIYEMSFRGHEVKLLCHADNMEAFDKLQASLEEHEKYKSKAIFENVEVLPDDGSVVFTLFQKLQSG